jgi:hypothetical protein
MCRFGAFEEHIVIGIETDRHSGAWSHQSALLSNQGQDGVTTIATTRSLGLRNVASYSASI